MMQRIWNSKTKAKPILKKYIQLRMTSCPVVASSVVLFTLGGIDYRIFLTRAWMCLVNRIGIGSMLGLGLFFSSVEGGAVQSLKLDFPVTKFTLSNDLTVLLYEDHSVPLISYHTWYRVGSKNEELGLSGAAHMLEHMMFKGAAEYTGSDFDKILHQNGMSNNAFTTNDYTGFYQELPSDKLELMMKIEVDRMAHLALREEDLQSEREVVKEERRWRVDNSPMGSLLESLMDLAFRGTPYSWPVIGTMKDIEQYSVQKLRGFYDRFYGPNNAVLVLVGDFNIETAKRLIHKYYDALPRRVLPDNQNSVDSKTFKSAAEIFQIPRKNRKVVGTPSSQRIEIRRKVSSSTAMVAYRTVKVGHPDTYPLDLMANILGAGASSRLHQKFVIEKPLSTHAFASNWTLQGEGLFYVGLSAKPGVEISQQLLTELKGELKKIVRKKLSTEEVEKAKAMVLKEHVDSLMTYDGKARALALNEILTGNYQSLFSDIEKYMAVTPQEIQEVATRYLTDENSFIVVLRPEPPQKIRDLPNQAGGNDRAQKQ